MDPKYPLILVDGSGYLFRAYHALPKLTNSKGEPTGALVGVLAMLRKLIEAHRPRYIGVVFDAPGKTFRDHLFPAYKANRPAMPDDLRAQIEPLQAVVRAMGLPLLVLPDVEADDVIGTLATQAAGQGIATLISTADKDLAQLVGDHITLVNTMTDTLLDRAGVIAKFGVPPERIVDYLSLVGDAVDNVPGVAKCGPKTAAKWIQDFGDLDGVIANADRVPGKAGENLRLALDQLPLARQLTSIKRDVALDLGPADLTPTPVDTAVLRGWYERLEARRLLSSLNAETVVDECAAPPVNRLTADYDLVLTEDALDVWVDRLMAADLFAFDTETTGLDYMSADLVGVSFCVEPGRAAYVPVAHGYPGAPDQLTRAWVLERLRPLLEDPGRAKVGQNLKYDMSVLARHGVSLRGVAHDTMLESYVLDSTATRHNMDALAKKYLDYDTVHYEDIAGKGVKQLTFDQIPLEPAGHYAAEDADITLRLHQTLWPRVEGTGRLASVYAEHRGPADPRALAHGAYRRADRPRPPGVAKPGTGPTHPGTGATGL